MLASAERTRMIMERYWEEGHDPTCITEDAVFIDMGTGGRAEGRDAIAALLRHFYTEAFTATPEVLATMVCEGRAVIEATVVGTHTGDYRGIPATGREIRVPLCVTYDVGEDGIEQARIYLQDAVLMEQIGAS
jgi:predicted ester cyclase